MTMLDVQSRGQALIRAARAQQRTTLDEAAGKSLLAIYGVRVPQTRVVSAQSSDFSEAVATACASMQGPWVLKVMSATILHKSDVGGVRLGLCSVAEVSAAISTMLQSPEIKAHVIDGFLIEEMAPAGQEWVVGGWRDPQFGPLVMVGLGGIFIEVLKDVAFRLCPISQLDAEDMIGELKAAALLTGVRGQPPASAQALIAVLLQVGGEQGLLMQQADAVMEMDINPLMVTADAAVAVDARFILG